MVQDIFVERVKEHYRGPSGVIWEMLMSEHIHVGGVEDTQVLAKKARISRDSKVLDVCCALGGPARYLAQNYGCCVTGLDATDRMLEEAFRRNKSLGVENLIQLKLGNALEMPFEEGTFDIVWAQDAWCYISNRERLIKECARVIKPQGVIAFTDWLETERLNPRERERILAFMVFPGLETFPSYARLLEENGFSILEKEDLNDNFASHMRAYQVTLEKELKSQIIDKFGSELYLALKEGIDLLALTAQENKVSRGRFIGRRIRGEG